MSSVKSAVDPTTNDHLARVMSAMDTELIRMKYVSTSMNDASYNLRKIC